MLTPTRVTIAFSDGVEREFSVASGECVLDAGLAADLPLLHQCRSGSCSSCIATLEEGEASPLPGAGSVLTATERARGLRLLCVTTSNAECRFRVDYDSAIGANRPRTCAAFVNAVDRVADDVVRLELELADGHWLEFQPGQFIQLTVPGTEALRTYSMASTQADLPRIVLLVRLLPDGVMSDWLLNRAKPDDVIEIVGPFGAFFLKHGVRAPHVMIAGGTGLAPMMSMIDAIRATPGRKPDILLSFGCQSEASLFYMEEIALRRHWLPSLDARISVDRGPAPEGARIGNPVEAVGAEAPLDPESVAYLCGPPAMVDAARRRLEHLGLKADRIFAEQFVPSQ